MEFSLQQENFQKQIPEGLLYWHFLSSLAEARHMRYFSGVVGGSVNFCRVFAFNSVL